MGGDLACRRTTQSDELLVRRPRLTDEVFVVVLLEDNSCPLCTGTEV